MIGVETWLAIALGGALGAVLRWSIDRLVLALRRHASESLAPINGTLVVNVLGSLALGWMALRDPTASTGADPSWLQPFWSVGLCGALTTFSTLCADAAGEARRAGATRMLLYVALTIGLGLVALALGGTMAP